MSLWCCCNVVVMLLCCRCVVVMSLYCRFGGMKVGHCVPPYVWVIDTFINSSVFYLASLYCVLLMFVNTVLTLYSSR